MGVALVLAVATIAAPTTPEPDALDDWRAIASLAAQVDERLADRSVHLEFQGGDAQLGGGPELWRRLHASGRAVRVPASYTGGTSGVWALRAGEEPDAWVRLIGEPDGRVAPPVPPVEVLGIGIEDRGAAEAWIEEAAALQAGLPAGPVVLAPDALARARSLDGDRTGETDRVLADARLAMYDRVVLAEIAAGGATSSPITAAQASSLLAGLDGARYLAVVLPRSP